MSQFLSPAYWFKLRPGDMDPTAFRTLLGFVIIYLALAVVFLFVKRRKSSIYRKIWLKLYNFFSANTIIGIMLVFFVYQRLAFLSMRFWLLVWLLGMAVWLGFIIREFFKIPEIRENIAKQREYRKYLPR